MGKENKYYTPEIEEFNVGFEYQVEDLHDNFVDKTWRYDKMNSGTDLMILEEWLKKDEIRVKHLDRSDIESCGWSEDGQTVDEDDPSVILDSYMLSIDNTEDKEKYYNLTVYNDGTGRVNIEYVYYRNSVASVHHNLFRGILKNKSELKRVLKMIGI